MRAQIPARQFRVRPDGKNEARRSTPAAIAARLNLSDLVGSLLRADPDILEIVLFGSAAYASDLARDVDVLVLTRAKKDYDVYFDAAWSVESPLNIDVIPQQRGEPWGEALALSDYPVGKSLYGDGVAREEAKKYMGVPTCQRPLMIVFVNLSAGCMFSATMMAPIQRITPTEYYKWRGMVSKFIDDLERETNARQQES
jgi:predicted nucleotidyltransferase